MKRLLGIIGLVALSAMPTNVDARHVQSAKVRYSTSEGQSKWYTVDVNFLTGLELNTATSSFRYNAFKSYAVVFWGNDQASVILINSPIMFCSGEFTNSCLPIFGRMKGTDQQNTEWEVCTALFCN